MNAYLLDALRTPFGRYGGSLSSVRPDDLAARTLSAILERNPEIDPSGIEDVIMGCANQAGEDNRNVARMAALVAGLPKEVAGTTINRLCGSGMDAILMAARTIHAGDGEVILAGGVESMSRAPMVMPKQSQAFGRNVELYDTTLGWRFVNPELEKHYGTDSMGETGENVAERYGVTREDQDRFALRSQEKTAAAQKAGRFQAELVSVSVPQRKKDPILVDTDEHPRPNTTLDALQALRPAFRQNGSVTAGNASGINDGAAMSLLVSEATIRSQKLTPLVQVAAGAVAGVEPAIMGMGPVAATRKLLDRTGVSLEQVDVIEINEAFASQSLACLRELGLGDDNPNVNPNGGAIAIGHPLGASGTRLVASAAHELKRRDGRYALATMCIGVGQGIAILLERAWDRF